MDDSKVCTHRPTMKCNYVLDQPDVGRSRRPLCKLPPLDFTYGNPSAESGGSVREALFNWYQPTMEKEKDEVNLESMSNYDRKLRYEQINLNKVPDIAFGDRSGFSEDIKAVMCYGYRQLMIENMKDKECERREKIRQKEERLASRRRVILRVNPKVEDEPQNLWKMKKFLNVAMEVLDNGSHIKGSENQATGINFSCRIPRDVNIGSGTVPRHKSETDVQLLLACKTQLSSEVIRWKTESLRLQKERDAARIKMKELDYMAAKLSDKTKELESRLFVAEDENKKLRKKMLGLPNTGALKRVHVNSDKFHSYPWSETLQKASPAVSDSCLNTIEMEKGQVAVEDWKEVSQKLLDKMKQEMKEISEFSSFFSVQENKNEQTKEIEKEIGDISLYDNDLEECVSSLVSDHESLKQCLLQQNKVLTSLINDITQGKLQLRTEEIARDVSKGNKTSQSNLDHSVIFVKPKTSINQYSRHSDESFRAFFTKQLDGCQNLDKVNKTMQLFMQSDSQNVPESSRSASKFANPRTMKSQTEINRDNYDKKSKEEERVCPICEASFHESIPQNEFEEHVLDHLEVESASLLDQYVVL